MITEKQNQSFTGLEDMDKAIRAFIQSLDKSLRFSVNSGECTYSDFFKDKILIIQAIRKGFPYDLFKKIKDVTPFTEEDWAEYLSISTKTLQRYSNEPNFVFKPIHTEKIIELAEVTNFGMEIFDSQKQFYLWLKTPSYALGNLKPAELLKDSYGKELVMNELNRIDQGIFA